MEGSMGIGKNSRARFLSISPLEAHRFQGEILGGTDGTRTRDLLPDRRAF